MYARRAQRYAAPPASGGPIITDGLISRWAFEEGSGLIANDPVGGKTGDLVGMDDNDWVAGIAADSNYALDFGTTQQKQVNVPSNPYTAADVRANGLTMIICVNHPFRRINGLYVAVCGGANQAGHGYSAGGIDYQDASSYAVIRGQIYIGGYVYVNFPTPQYALPENTTTYLSLVVDFDLNEVFGYFNGDLAASSPITSPAATMFEPNFYTIGMDHNGREGRGINDDHRLYLRALSQSEIAQIAAGNG